MVQQSQSGPENPYRMHHIPGAHHGNLLQGISASRNATADFESFFSDRFIAVRHLQVVLKNIIKLQTNMTQETALGERGDWAEVANRKENSKDADYILYRRMGHLQEKEPFAKRKGDGQGMGGPGNSARELRMKYYRSLDAKQFDLAGGNSGIGRCV
jgi:hypothetical protein